MLYVTRKDGTDPTVDDVRELLDRYTLAAVWAPTQTECEALGLENGVWVRFERFGEFKDALRVCCAPVLVCCRGR